MPDSDKTLKILLQVQSEVADLQKVNAGLDQVKAKTNETAAAAGSLSTSFSGGLGAIAIGAAAGAAVIVAKELFRAIVDVQQESTRVTEEIRKQSDAVSAQIGTWQELAAAAENFGDTVRIGDKIAPQLAQAAAVMAKFRAEELTGWEKFVDGVINLLNKIPSPIIGQPGVDLSTNAGNNAAQLSGSASNLFNSLQAGAQARDAADSAAAAASQLRALPAAEAIKILDGQIKDLTKSILGLDAQARPSALALDPESLAANERAAQQLKTESDTLARKSALLTEISGKQTKANEQLEKTAAAATIIEDKLSGNIPKLAFDTATEKVRQLRSEWQKLGPLNAAQEAALTITFKQTQANVLAQQQHTSASAATKEAHRDIVAFLSEENALLRENRQNQQLIEQDPFLSFGEKTASLLQFIPQEINEINAKMAEGRKLLANTALDPATVARANIALQNAEFRVAVLGQKLKTLTFGGQLRAELVELGNQLALTGQKVGQVFSGTLTTAISGVSSGITNLITGAGTFAQAWNSAVSSVINQFVQLGVETAVYYGKLFVQWAIQKTLATSYRSADVTEHVAAETTKAGASGISALLTSISSWGLAAAVGLAALVAAVAYFAVSGFESGGYTGDGGIRDVAGLVHRREYVFDAPTVERGGGRIAFDNLRLAINRPGYERGGFTGGASTSGRPPTRGKRGITIIQVRDEKEAMREFMKSRDAETHIVRVVNGRGGHLRA